ncbi:pericentrin isoform X8 [Pithys albifrons albifrons]|uniref:pericentrin isoform X8 n=1 Tax=Pithys albifrons albifrons TaxID=3385563 RepID=UPI003A5CEF2D
MEGAREEPPQRRLKAGRARERFADFRRREATGDVAESQEEAAPGPGSAVHAHDLPQEELPVAPTGAGGGTQGKAGDTNPLEAETAETEGDADLSNWDALSNHGTEKGRRNSAAGYSEGDAEMCQARIAELENRLVEKQEAVERLTAQMDELQDQLTQHNNSMHLQETTVQEQNELILRLSRCLQQAKGDRDELQEEALRVAAQIQDLQLQLHQVNEMVRNKSLRKKEELEAQQQINSFQNRLREQSAHLERLHQVAQDLQAQLESSQKSTKDKENLLAQMEEDMKGTVQELQKSINEKEQHIQRLQDLLTSERFGLSVMQQTLCLRDSEIAELKKEIVLSKVKEQQHIEELKTFHEKDLCRQVGNLRNELEKFYRREIAEARLVCEEEIILKYKNELEQLKKELFASNSEEHIQNLNGIIIDLNVRLQESEMNKENLRKRLENQQEDFQREKSEMETKYKDLIGSLKCQLSDAEGQAKEAQRYKQEKESLNEEIQKLNSLIWELNEKRLSEAEKGINVRQKCDGEIAFNKKLMKLREKQISSGVSQLQVAGLEEMWHKPQQSEGGEELEFQPDSSRDHLEEIKDSEITESNESSKGYNLSEGHLSELGLFNGDEGILAKYLISMGTPEESNVSSTWEARAIEEGRCSTCGLDNSELLEPNRGFISPPLNSSLDEGTCPSGLAQEAFEEVGAEGFVTFVSENYLQENKLRDRGDLRGGETMCSAERCAKLSEQLHQESALKIPYQEAFQKWEKAVSELSHVQAKLEEERAARICCEQRLLQRMEKEEELENKLMFLVKQQGEAGGQPQCAVEALTQESNPSVWQEMVRDLQEERERLMVQLRAQEQLVRDVQEQKTASDSVTSEVQSLFGRQLAALQSQRDQVQSQLDAQKVKNQRIAELLGQKTVAEEMLLKEQELLKAEISNKEQNLALLLEEKAALGERLSEVEEDLVKAEKALAENAGIIEDLEKNIKELNAEIKNLRETQECERLDYEDRLNLSNQEIHKLTAEIKEKSLEYSEEKSQLTEEIACLQRARLELEARLQESLQAAQEAQATMEKHQREELDKMATQHLAELTEVSLTHKREMEELNAEMKDKVENQEKLEEKRKEEIAIIKKVHEREHDREISELAAKHQEEMEKLRAELREEQRHLLEELQQQMEATHKAEQEQAQLQAQTLHSLELEALRLTLNNMHTSQLELALSNLRKEKETALVELREMLNDKRAQEVAILQSRHQMERENIRELCLREKEDLRSKHQQELVDQRKKIELEMEERHIQALEILKRDWELESDTRLKNMCDELCEKHQTDLMQLQKSLEMDLEKVKAELGLLSVENEQSKIKCVELERQHQLAIAKLQEQLQAEHYCVLEEMKMKTQEKEQNLQKELDQLQVKHEQLKAQSQEEIRQLWAQLENTRANRQELSDGEPRMQACGPELKEQLLARASQVEEIECLKQEFEQQRQQRNSEHEAQLEQLRLYFEEKLRVAEENYREELTLLHQRLQELKDCSLSELEMSSSITVSEEAAEKERRVGLDQLNQLREEHQEELACLQLQLKEQHRLELDSLKSSLALQYKEELMKMKMDLSDKCVTEIEAMKRKHCLELEHLRAQLSEEHFKELTRLRLQSAHDAAQQVEVEVAERVSVLEEEHKARLSLLRCEKQHMAELSEEIRHLKEEILKQKEFSEQNEKHLREEMEKEKYKVAEDHKNQLREEVQKIEAVYKEKEEKWHCEREAQRVQAEEKLSELRSRAESERQNLQKEFEFREAQMKQLQDHQAAKILELEKLVKEQQNSLQQLEDSLAQAVQEAQQDQADLQAAKALMAQEMEKATLCLQEECALKLREAQNKFMEEHKALTQDFTTEQEILLQELKKKHVDELELQSQQLQEKHKQQILSLTADLQTKHQAEMETLKSTLERKQQIQLEGFVAELQTKHQSQMDELEAKHLSNLDSLESSYLSEIQNIRDEHSQALDKLQLQHREQLQEQDKMHQTRLAQEVEKLKLKHAEELQLSQNNLKIELATVHMEKLKAMALEAQEAHKDDLNTALRNQRQLLEEEKRVALDLLRGEVLEMEEKHRKALQELQDLHQAEIRKHKEEYSRELEEELGKLKAQHEHEQKLYASASASEVDSVRTALLAQFEEVKLKQQLQFQEEIELLKCQSEVLLEQQITQLKDEFEAEKKASLHDKEQMLIQEREKAQAAHQKEQEILSVQLQEKTAMIIQLEKEVESLKQEIEETNSELETLLQRRDRENQEGGNLVALLRSDIEQSKEEREKLRESYEHVLNLLMELVKATIAIEDLVCSRIGLCLDDSLVSGDSKEAHSIMEEMGFMQCFKAKENSHLEKAEELLDETLTEHNQLSPGAEEVSELSQHLCESVFAKPELACENEEIILKICHRLRTAVERLLELVTESTKQLEKMHENHAQFEKEFSRRNEETAQVVSQHQELMECLSEESEAKNQLALELHKAEGIIEGYVAEKAALEEALSLKEESERRLVVELENMRERFQELTQEQAILGLLKEVEFLSKEKLDLQCQAEKDHSNLRSQMKVLEVELEEQLHSNQDLATQLLEVAELKQQIKVLEKQLRNQRQFMDEQAIEREHERDDFQQEIQKLEEQLKLSSKSQPSGQPRECRNYELILQVESLQAELREKMDDYNKLLLEKEQKHEEITARDKEIEKLLAQIQDLKGSSAEVSKTVHGLEQQLQKMKKVETDLKQDKEALQQQQYNNLLQISALQSKLDEARHRVPVDGTAAPELKEQLQAEHEALKAKEREIASLLDQLEQYKDNLSSKNEEIMQLNLQLEVQKSLSTSSISQLKAENAHLKEDLTKLHVKQSQDLGINDSSALSFPQALLEEKNQEIDHLNEQMKRLQQELENALENKEKDEVMFDLTTQNTNPKTQIKQSQENILLKELDMIHSSEEDQGLKKHCQQMLEVHQTPNSPKHNLDIDKDTSKDFQNLVVSMSSWGSPEIMRKQDNSLELQPVLHLTPFSEPENTDLEMLHTRSSLQGDNSVSLGYPHLDETGSGNAVVGGGRRSPAFSESTYSVDDDDDDEDEDMQEKMLQMREADNLPLTPSDLQDDVRSRASVISSTSSSLAAQLKQELQRSDHLSANAMACLHYQGVFPDIMESVKEREVLSPQLKTVLKMVYEESQKILALSEHPFGFRELKKVPQTQVVMEGWQKEGLALLDAIQSLRDYLGKVAERGDKETSGVAADWRGELLQAVQNVFEKERNVLQIDLKSHFSNPASGDASSLVEKLEYIMKQQEEQRQMVVEHLFSSDRNSLLWEIQDLRAQLRLTHLQNQEKLQQLQETLTKAEDHGNKQEHQLRRKVELLEYKLQQEKSIVSDLHSSLSEEQKRSSETCDLLNQEKATLKSALHDSEQENERLQKSLEELQREINQLRFELEKKEKDLAAALEELQAEQLKESELRGWAEEQQHQHKKAEDEKTKAVEELQAALDVQVVQNRQLVVSLEHERTVAANLRKELQIEQSRCEALLSQEHTKLRDLQKDLDAEKNRSLELLQSLNHERVLTEQLSMRLKEGASCQHRESLLEQAFVQQLQAQLEEERSRTRELAAVIEKMHQKAIQSQRQLEAEVQMCCEETQKEREVSDKLRATLESLQAQKQEVIHSLEAQKEREAKLKADWEQLQSLFRMLKEQDKTKKEEREGEQRQQQQSEQEKQQGWQKDQERMQNLEWQQQRDEQRIKELQEVLAVLEERGRNLSTPNHQQELLCTSNKDGNARQAGTKETEKPHLQQQQQQLEKIRQQLLFVAVHLNEFIYKTLDKTVQDWSASNDEAVASLLQTLKELKSDLLSSASQIRSAGDGETVPELEKEVWQRERHVLQSALKQAESQLAKANAEAENKPVVETSNHKLQRLYRKYIRAESFRKALVYQKKYLLLLLGGFQDCEQATLSLIARMGIFPSPAALQLSGARSRPFTRFRCAARAIIAISRLKFLVKKWNKVGRKSTQGETISHSVGGNTAPGARTEVLKEQQLPAVPTSSPPTRDRAMGLCHRASTARFGSLSPRPSPRSHNRLHQSPSSAPEKSPLPPPDPERSLTEYIHRLELIQQRLWGMQPGQAPGSPRQRNMKK